MFLPVVQLDGLDSYSEPTENTVNSGENFVVDEAEQRYLSSALSTKLQVKAGLQLSWTYLVLSWTPLVRRLLANYAVKLGVLYLSSTSSSQSGDSATIELRGGVISWTVID